MNDSESITIIYCLNNKETKNYQNRYGFEIKSIELGIADKKENLLKNAPHTQEVICADEWTKPYSRQQAAFPLSFVNGNKFWPSVSRVNNTFGDRNLICTCEPIESYQD